MPSKDELKNAIVEVLQDQQILGAFATAIEKS